MMGTIESEPADSCDTFRNNTGFGSGLRGPGNQHTIPDIDKRAVRNSKYGIAPGNLYFFQAVVCKSSLLNIGDAGRNDNPPKPVTIVKCIRANGFQTFRQGNIGQERALIKAFTADAFHACRQGDGNQPGADESFVFYFADAVRHIEMLSSVALQVKHNALLFCVVQNTV